MMSYHFLLIVTSVICLVMANINLEKALISKKRHGWTKTVQHCYDRHESFTDFRPNAFQRTEKWACNMLRLDMDQIVPGNDTVYGLGLPLTVPAPYYYKLTPFTNKNKKKNQTATKTNKAIKFKLYLEKEVNYTGGYNADGFASGQGLAVGYNKSQSEYLRSYNGTWVNGVLQGYGEVRELGVPENLCRFEYSGNFVNGMKVGDGKETSPLEFKDDDGANRNYSATYVGQFKMNARSGFGRQTYSACDGKKQTIASYEGEWLNKKWHGHGEVTYCSGGAYKGEFQNGRREGQGQFNHSYGDIYKGHFSKNHRHGAGVLMTANGSLYQGNYVNGHPQGWGKWKFHDGKTFEGLIFSIGRQNGSMTSPEPNGFSYVGEMTKYKTPNGYGTKTTAIRIISGNWNQGRLTGFGTEQSLTSNATYEGEFAKTKRHGNGTMVYANGDIYVGEWNMGRRDGQGTLIFANGGNYTGEWAKDIRSGKGVEFGSDGSIYRGDFSKHRADGFGIYEYANGDRYEGQFRNGKWHGQGILTKKDGFKYEGRFRAEKKSGNGTLTFPNGDIYEGQFANGQRSGLGVMTIKASGMKYTGAYKHGNPTGIHTYINKDGETGNAKATSRGGFENID